MRHWLLLRLGGALVAALALPLTASAGTIQCGNEGGCVVTLSINGNQLTSGTFSIDSSTGNLSLPETLMASTMDGSTLKVTDVHGNADPILGYAAAARTP